MTRAHTLTTALTIVALVLAAVAAGTAGAKDGRTADREVRSPVPAFILDRGRYESFEADDTSVTLAAGDITNGGVIVGEYLAPDRESGFVRDTRGRITRIDLPGAKGTQVDKINARGQIVGNSSKHVAFLPGDGSRGYVLERGRVTRIDVPGARLTAPHGINDRGEVVGQFTDTNGRESGFLWALGRITRLDKPGASSTVPTAINDRGEIVGTYADERGLHGFHLRDGRYTTIDAPGGPRVTIAWDVNDRGQIVVSALDPTDQDPLAGARGFVLGNGVRGAFTEIRFPGAPRTLPLGIDDRGRIVGIYENPDAAPTPGARRAAAMPPLDALPLRLAKRKETP